MSNLSNYRKASTEKLQKALASTQTKFKKDARYWEISPDKEGNGEAIIRFLDRPPVDGDDAVPVVSYYSHNFQGPGGWYIENSITSEAAGSLQDPVSEYNSKLWKTGLESNKKIARVQKRKLTVISNILVIKDAAKPDNNGKVFLYRFGQKILDKINIKQNPVKGSTDVDGNLITPVNVFDLWEGCNFLLKCKNQPGGDNDKKYRNYDDSVFSDKLTPIAKTDAEIENIINQAYSLKGELKFKTYDELKKQLDRVLAFNSQATPNAEKQKVNTDISETESVNESASVLAAVNAAITSGTITTEDEENDLEYFKNLVQYDE